MGAPLDVTVLAHGVGGRTDLPVPLWMAIYGAGIAVVLSFAALGALWPRPRLTGEKGRALPRGLAAAIDSPVLVWALRALVLAVSGLMVAAAFFGAPGEESNPVPWFLYIVFWVGLVPVSLLFGPVWKVVNPLRTIHLLIATASGSDPDEGLREMPAGLGYWPAAASLAGFVWLELVYPFRADPRAIGLVLVVYAAVHVVAASVYGAGWFARADGFEVYSTLIARLSPLGRLPDRRLALRNPLDNLAGLRAEPGLVGVVAVLLGSTAYDGVTRTQWWKDVSEGDAFGWPQVPRATLTLALCVGLVAGTYVLATRLSGRPAGADPRPLPGAFVHSVIPIAIGYAVAHYFSLLVLEGQQAWILASDPFGKGADWFGTAGWTVNFTVLTPRTTAVTQIAAVVVGHILGVIAAHDRAVGLFKGKAAVKGQYALLVVMVAYTLGGVALLLGT
ncbi:MAG TPA: hypothetical protein VGX28_04435 [Frankiaceae bacterium]|nr:hypothetical protein [Frankiaceae bacterium]